MPNGGRFCQEATMMTRTQDLMIRLFQCVVLPALLLAWCFGGGVRDAWAWVPVVEGPSEVVLRTPAPYVRGNGTMFCIGDGEGGLRCRAADISGRPVRMEQLCAVGYEPSIMLSPDVASSMRGDVYCMPIPPAIPATKPK